MAKAAHKPGMVHRYHAVEALERRCKRLERAANSQLRAMVRNCELNEIGLLKIDFCYLCCLKGEDKEWQLHWRHLGLNAFSPDRTPMATPPTTTKKPGPKPESGSSPNTATNQLKRSVVLATLPPLPELIEEVTTSRPSRTLPSFLTRKYQDFCELQAMAYASACCPVDLFEHPEADSLEDWVGFGWWVDVWVCRE